MHAVARPRSTRQAAHRGVQRHLLRPGAARMPGTVPPQHAAGCNGVASSPATAVGVLTPECGMACHVRLCHTWRQGVHAQATMLKSGVCAAAAATGLMLTARDE